MRVRLSRVEVRPRVVNVRRLDRRHVAVLRRSIEERGLVEPLVVLEVGGSLVLVSGFHRHEALRQIGRDRREDPDVEVVLWEGTVEEARLANLASNVARKALEPAEIAETTTGLVESGFDVSEVARSVGLSRGWLAAMVAAWSGAAVPTRKAALAGRISMTVLSELAKVEGEDRQVETLRRILDEGGEVWSHEGRRRARRIASDAVRAMKGVRKERVLRPGKKKLEALLRSLDGVPGSLADGVRIGLRASLDPTAAEAVLREVRRR